MMTIKKFILLVFILVLTNKYVSAYTVKNSQSNNRNLQIYTKKCRPVPQTCLEAFMSTAYYKINLYRSRHRVKQLLPGSLKDNNTALDHACYLASTFRFEYNLEIDDIKSKENLYQGYQADYFNITADDCQEYAERFVDIWYGENSNYDFGNGNRLEEENNADMIEHFAQMVWKSTEQVSFGLAFSSQPNPINNFYYYYVVADYSPPGNFIGEYLDNVLPLKKKRVS